ncbi:MAG: hypothetical protein S4CHLAM7_04180 [Chlamydiae bacterium]|nr:hypothetical protein [Chlamydiota bacterium]
MKKLWLILAALPLLLGACKHEHKETDSSLSVLENDQSIINEWYGVGHFDEPHKAKCPPAPEEENTPTFSTPGGVVTQNQLPLTQTTEEINQAKFFSSYLFEQTEEKANLN